MKGILVLNDMPLDCTMCPLHDMSMEGDWLCLAAGQKWIMRTSPMERPEWCPLMEMPKKKPVNNYEGSVADIKNYGWNDCIETIAKSVRPEQLMPLSYLKKKNWEEYMEKKNESRVDK